ncbi:nuA4 complex subunit EAF3 homolog [Drosophila innubila]|uniref:nuA4 complex subunit EAF3 homolog n=1 Tax=Drosophila innubila TaxID=198719 RepID=UPI00148BF6C4|nr:nuA4 complex subunit EAF3 homolog [Drosophila innubila]
MGEVKPVKMDTNWAPTDSATLFADGERVLCFHGPLIYEAKVLKTKPETTPVEYYIHYAGWSKNWDEWVPESRVLKYNDENVKRQKEVSRQYGERSKKDNKKGSAKAKKMEQVGNESRASTPSKDGNTSLPSTGVSSGSSATTSTPVTTVAAATKYDSSNSSSTTTSTSTNTTTATSRSNRKSTHSATAAIRPGTPSGVGTDKKEDAPAAADIADDEVPAPAPPKTKRISSQNSSDQQRTSTTSNGPDATTTTTPQQQQTTATGTTTTATGATTTTAGTATTAAAVGTAEAPCVESEETYTTKLEVKIKIPDELKHYLTDDWYAVVREHKLLELPAKVTVQQITDQYLAHKKSVKSTSASKEVAINDVLDGIIEYFNVMLGSQLLYKFERTQYTDIMQKHPDTPLSELYGSFHLLRLFVRLGSMLSYSALDQPAMQTLLAHLHDFLKFLVKNSAMYFSMTNFINVDPEYVRNAQ